MGFGMDVPKGISSRRAVPYSEQAGAAHGDPLREAAKNIIVHGQQFNSWDDVPTEIKATLIASLPDANHDGVSDIFQGGPLPDGGQQAVSSHIISVDGRAVNSLAAVPPDIKRMMQAAGFPFGQPESTRQPMDPSSSEQFALTAPPVAPPQPGHVVLDGVPVDASQEIPGVEHRRHWWQRR